MFKRCLCKHCEAVCVIADTEYCLTRVPLRDVSRSIDVELIVNVVLSLSIMLYKLHGIVADDYCAQDLSDRLHGDTINSFLSCLMFE